MNKTSFFVVIIVIIIIIAGIVYVNKGPQTSPTPTPSVSAEVNAAVRAQVTAFGTKLKNVSLLATSTVAAQIQTEYGPYVAPELISAWQSNPSDALGRNVSSPWPDRIDIVEVSMSDEDSVKVEANVIEVTSAGTTTQPAAVYPITLTLENRSGTWLITSAQKGAYSTLPQRTTITGMWECLPHKDTSGPQTLECAFGIAETGTGNHYGLDLNLLSGGPTDYPTGTRVRVEGILTPIDQLSSNSMQKYNIVGIIGVTSVQKL